MSIINECKYCLPEVNKRRTYRKQTEIYDAIGIDVQMCLNCGEAALFERERIIEIIESRSRATSLEALIALIKGETIE